MVLTKRWCEQQEDELQKEAKQKYRGTVQAANRRAKVYRGAAGQSRKTRQVRVGSNGAKEMLWRSSDEDSSFRDIGEANKEAT